MSTDAIELALTEWFVEFTELEMAGTELDNVCNSTTPRRLSLGNTFRDVDNYKKVLEFS